MVKIRVAGELVLGKSHLSRVCTAIPTTLTELEKFEETWFDQG